MPSKYHKMAASAALALTILAMIAFQILSFHVPYMADLWAAQDTPLTGWQTMLIRLSEVAVANRPVLFLLLPAMFFMALIWHGILWMLTLHAKRKQAFGGSQSD